MFAATSEMFAARLAEGREVWKMFEDGYWISNLGNVKGPTGTPKQEVFRRLFKFVQPLQKAHKEQNEPRGVADACPTGSMERVCGVAAGCRRVGL